MAKSNHHVYLIPGFFGFAHFGDFKYFAHVRDVLDTELAARGIRAQIHYVLTRPTASLRSRALRLREVIAETSSQADQVHLVGHSSGGLDARLLVSPGVDLGENVEVEPIAARVRSVVTIGTPHHGTPLASLFISLPGQHLLRLLSVVSVYIVRRGPLPLRLAARLVNVMRALDERGAKERNTIDQLFDQVLSEFTSERQQTLTKFFEDVSKDQGLLPQLVPEGAELLNAALSGRPGVREGSVVLRARPPKLGTAIALGFDPYAQAMHTVYWWLHRQTAGAEGDLRFPLTTHHQESLALAFGDVPPATANDAIVPTRSQAWRTIVHAAWADHLDAVGHFYDPQHDPPHYDWITSGTRFRRSAFEALWRDVAAFLAS